MPARPRTADDNRATIQTGEANSGEVHAENARMYATTADGRGQEGRGAAEKAAAAGCGNAADADMYKDAAEAAKKAADDGCGDGRNPSATTPWRMPWLELKIDGTVKSVGGTTIDAAASSSVVTTDGVTVATGLQDNDLHAQCRRSAGPRG